MDKNSYRSFIEVQDLVCATVKDTKSPDYGFWLLDDKGEYIRENYGDPYWVEVQGLESDYVGTPSFVERLGYQDPVEAAAVAEEGIKNWPFWYAEGRLLPKGGPFDARGADDSYKGSAYFSGHYTYTGPR